MLRLSIIIAFVRTSFYDNGIQGKGYERNLIRRYIVRSNSSFFVLLKSSFYDGLTSYAIRLKVSKCESRPK